MEVDCLEISTRNNYIIYPQVKYLLRTFYSAQWQISILSQEVGNHPPEPTGNGTELRQSHLKSFQSSLC